MERINKLFDSGYGFRSAFLFNPIVLRLEKHPLLDRDDDFDFDLFFSSSNRACVSLQFLSRYAVERFFRLCAYLGKCDKGVRGTTPMCTLFYRRQAGNCDFPGFSDLLR